MRAAFAVCILALSILALPVLALSVTGGCARAEPLAPYHARFDLTLARLKSGDVIGASGDMSYQFRDMCKAWTTTQRLRIHVIDRENGDTETDSDYATLESKDGRHFTFLTRQMTDGTEQSRIAGEADRLADGRVRVRYTSPSEKTMTLARGTLFPVEHTQMVIAAAARGEQTISPDLFDGTSENGAFHTFVFVQEWQSRSVGVPVPGLAAVPSARVHIGFFGTKPEVMGPEFELGARYFANGIADRLRMDFGDFAMDGALRDIGLYPEGMCGR